MDTKTVVPSLTNLSHFAEAIVRGLKSPVANHRRQAEAPKEGRFPSFYYESFLSGVIDFVSSGMRGSALREAVQKATDSKKASYSACAEGIGKALEQLRPSRAARGRRVQVQVGDELLVKVRFHLDLTVQSGDRVLCFLHFSGERLTVTELALVETAVALAARQIDHPGRIAVIYVRSGEVRYVDGEAALSDLRVARLRAISVAYQEEWANS